MEGTYYIIPDAVREWHSMRNSNNWVSHIWSYFRIGLRHAIFNQVQSDISLDLHCLNLDPQSTISIRTEVAIIHCHLQCDQNVLVTVKP